MRLCSYRDSREGERLAVVAADHALPASNLLNGGPRTIAELFAGGESLLSALLSAADNGRIARDGMPLAELQLLAPVPHPGKVVAIGRNYREHAAEENVEPPPAPLIFAKWPSSVVGSGAEVRWDPQLSAKVDYEAELAVVIGTTARHVPATLA